MATISNTPRPGYVWDSADNVWYPIGVGAHQHTNAADTPAVMPYSTYAAAGKNKILNGDFQINQRAFTSTTTDGTYGFDRWIFLNGGDGTATYSAQTFTAGTAPAAPYESTNFARLLTTGQTSTSVFTRLVQRIEDVRTLAGQTVTISFYAKAATGTPKIAIEQRQDFGIGGSTAVNTYFGQVTLSTSWARYSVTVSIPSISGNTIVAGSALNTNLYVSAGSDNNARTGSLGIQNNTFDIWGVQVEAGSIATPFQTATGTIAGELAACMRYAEKVELAAGVPLVTGQAYSTTNAWAGISWTTQKRTTPSITQTGTIQALQAGTGTSGTTFAYTTLSTNYARMEHSGGSGLVAGNATLFQAIGGTASLLITAEF